MKKDSFEKELEKYSKLTGYKKPEKYSNVIKLDSNENYVVSQEFLQKLINEVKENIDVREYPLGGTERLSTIYFKIHRNSKRDDWCWKRF